MLDCQEEMVNELDLTSQVNLVFQVLKVQMEELDQKACVVTMVWMVVLVHKENQVTLQICLLALKETLERLVHLDSQELMGALETQVKMVDQVCMVSREMLVCLEEMD